MDEQALSQLLTELDSRPLAKPLAEPATKTATASVTSVEEVVQPINSTTKEQKERAIDYRGTIDVGILEDRLPLVMAEEIPEWTKPPPPKGKIVFPNVSLFEQIVKAQATIVEVAPMTLTEDGLRSTIMDPSHVALLDINLSNESFRKWEVSTKTTFSYRIEDMQTILGRIKKMKRAEVELKLDENEEGLIHVIGRDDRTKEYTITDIQEHGEAPIPKLSFDVEICMAQKAFREILEDIEAKSDHINIEVSNEAAGILFSGKSDSGAAKVKVKQGDLDLRAITCRKESRGTYSIEYLQKIVKAVDATDVTISFSTRLPILLTFNIGDNMQNYIKFYLAPRVSE